MLFEFVSPEEASDMGRGLDEKSGDDGRTKEEDSTGEEASASIVEDLGSTASVGNKQCSSVTAEEGRGVMSE